MDLQVHLSGKIIPCIIYWEEICINKTDYDAEIFLNFLIEYTECCQSRYFIKILLVSYLNFLSSVKTISDLLLSLFLHGQLILPPYFDSINHFWESNPMGRSKLCFISCLTCFIFQTPMGSLVVFGGVAREQGGQLPLLPQLRFVGWNW